MTTMQTTQPPTSPFINGDFARARAGGDGLAGLRTTVLPAASAGASFQQAIGNGKFHGTMAATTPSGWRSVKSNPPEATGIVWPKNLPIAPA